jgi:hypothetical protein
VEAPVKKKKKGETTPKEKSPDYIKGLEVRATLLGSDTLDFATEKITASILSTVDNVEDYQKLFQTGRRESSFGGLLSQNTHNALEASQDRIGPYNQFGKLISGTAKKGTLTLDDELVTHVPLFRKLRSLLSLEPKRYIIKNEEGEIITTETFIKIADAVFLRQRIKQEVKLRKEEPTRDIISDDEENDEKAELGIEHLSTAEIDNRIKKMKRMRKSLDTKIMIWENARKAKDKKDKDEERRVERKEAQSDHEEDSENEKAKPTKRKIDAASPKRTSRRKKKRAKNT